MIISGVLIVTLVVLIFAGLFWGRKRAPDPVPNGPETTQTMIAASTATKSSSILDTEVQELNKSSTAAKKSSGGAGDRDALIRASSAQ